MEKVRFETKHDFLNYIIENRLLTILKNSGTQRAYFDNALERTTLMSKFFDNECAWSDHEPRKYPCILEYTINTDKNTGNKEIFGIFNYVL